MSKAEAMKLDILLGLKSKGYNLIEGDKPEIMTMNLGGGYILECNVKKPSNEWKIIFNDGIETSEYLADSEKVVFTYRKDADALIKEYENGVKTFETTEPKKKKSSYVKNARVQDLPGMMLPIAYPSEMVGSFMRFNQWAAKNDVIPAGSEVVILEESDNNYRVSIPQAHISFDIGKDKAGVVQA